MNAREQAGSEEVRFEDLDLVYIFSFDLGAPVEAEDLKKLLEWFSNSERYKIVEGIPSGVVGRPTPQFVYRKAKELEIEDAEKISIEELMKNEKLRKEIDRALAMFRAILSVDFDVCSSEYLKLGRYARLKLIDLNLSIKDKELSYLNELKCELYLLLHSAGIAVLTVWIHLNGNFSTDDVIEIERKKLYKAKCTIKDPSGIAEGTLYDVGQEIITLLSAVVLFKGEYGSYDAVFDALKKGDITKDKIEEKLRTMYTSVRIVVCIRKYRCNGKCATAEDAVENHLKEVAGISRLHKHWRYYRKNVAKKDLGKNLSLDVDCAIFVGGVSLFLGSTVLDEELKSEEDKELSYRRIELSLVQPMEFLSLSDMILEVYTSVYRSKSKEIKERRRGGETVRPSEVMEIREGLMDGLEEYNNVSLFIKDPERSIMEYGKRRLRLSDKVNMLKYLLEELGDVARTLYEEDISKTQTMLTVLFGAFGVFQASEVLGPLLGLPNAIIITSAILLPYPIYKLSSLYGRRKEGVLWIILLELSGIFQVLEFLERKIGLPYAIAAIVTFLLLYPIHKLFIGRRKKAVKSS